jgi:hypothetical protein
MCSLSTYTICCPEHARLEDEYLAARNRMRNLIRLRKPSRVSRSAAADKDEEHRLADHVAMAIARLKEHTATHGCERW